MRRGEWDLPRVVAWVEELEAKLEQAVVSSPLPDEPDLDWVNGWLQRSSLRYWETGRA